MKYEWSGCLLLYLYNILPCTQQLILKWKQSYYDWIILKCTVSVGNDTPVKWNIHENVLLKILQQIKFYQSLPNDLNVN